MQGVQSVQGVQGVQGGCLAPGLLPEEAEPLTAACYRKVWNSALAAASRYPPLGIISVKLMLNSSERKLSRLAFDPGNWSMLSALTQDLSWKRASLVPETQVNDEDRAQGLRSRSWH